MYLMLMLIVVLATSCSNDEIDIRETYAVTYNVSTQEMFDEFGISDDIRENYLRDKEYAIGITSYIYDDAGELVDSTFSYTYSYGVISQNIGELVKGNYTIVTVENLVDPNNDFKADKWYVSEAKRLETVKLATSDTKFFRSDVMGVSVKEVQISGGQTINVTPSAIGSLVHVEFKNFENTTHKYIGFLTDDRAGAYNLNPKLTREKKFTYDYTQTGYIISRCYLTPKDSKNYYCTIYVLDPDIDWTFGFVKAENAGKGVWSSYNANKGTATLEDGKLYYAGFYYMGDSTIPECYFGDKTGYESFISECENKSTFSYKEPYVQWGGSVASVQSFMSKYTMTVGAKGSAVAQNDGSYGLQYSGLGNETAIQYVFTSATTGLFESDLFFDKTKFSLETLNSRMSGNTLLAEKNGTYMYASSDSKSYIIVFESGDYNIIGYVDVNYLASSNAKALSRSNTNTSKAIEHINSMRYLLK